LLSNGGIGTVYVFNLLGSNTFTGAFDVGTGLETTGSGAGHAITINSLADSTSPITLNFGNTATFNLGSSASANLSVPNRPVNLLNSNITIRNQDADNTMTLGSVSTSTASAQTLRLAEGGFGGFISGAITNGAGSIAVEKVNSGTWSLSSADNKFTGAITMGVSTALTTSAGTLNYASAGGSNTITFNQSTVSPTLNYTGSGNQTMSGAITASSLTSGTLTLGSTGSGAVNYSNTASLGSAGSGNKNLTLTGASTGDNILAGRWQNNTGGAATLTKSGTGTWILTNTNNTYSGATNVSAGKLLVNGTTTASAFAVANGATLGGTGTIGGTVSVSTGATLSPGASIESLASGALTMASGSTFAYEVLDISATGADLLNVSGTLTLSNVNLSLDSASLLALAGASWTVGDKLTLISYGGTPITSGFVGYADDTNYTFGSNVWTFNYNDTSAGANFATDLTGSNRITLTAFTVVPEPSTALLTALGVLALLRRRR
jgi:autotransporter-associated beta strand protein